MRCAIIQPPLCDPSCPPLGLAYLSAALEEQAIVHEVFDLNLDFFDYCDGFASDRTGMAPTGQFDDTAKTRLAWETVSRLFPDLSIKSYQLDIPKAKGDLIEISRVALDPDGLFSTWFREADPLSPVLALEPEWIGISVSFLGQLPAALALAATCRQRSRATVIFGGALFKDFEQCIGQDTPIWNIVDGIVVGAGENVLRNLKKASDGRIRPINCTHLPEGRWIATSNEIIRPLMPSFRHFPLRRYRAVGLVLPYRVFPRCSWGMCTFCADAKYTSHLPSAGGHPEAVVEELTRLAVTYESEGINFLDAELPERFMLLLAGILSQRQQLLRWGANARFTQSLAHPDQARQLFEGGCRFLRFGLESASPRILKAMRKGIRLDIVARVLESAHQAGIATHVYLMRGFPGETIEDWSQTTEFLIRNAANIDMFNVSDFQLYNGSPLSWSVSTGDIIHGSTCAKWVHPSLPFWTSATESCEEIEETFFAHKDSTRCHPTPADTILLADRMPIRYRRTNANIGMSKPGKERLA